MQGQGRAAGSLDHGVVQAEQGVIADQIGDQPEQDRIGQDRLEDRVFEQHVAHELAERMHGGEVGGPGLGIRPHARAPLRNPEHRIAQRGDVGGGRDFFRRYNGVALHRQVGDVCLEVERLQLWIEVGDPPLLVEIGRGFEVARQARAGGRVIHLQPPVL